MRLCPALIALFLAGGSLIGCTEINLPDFLDSKKPLPGDRKAVFPEGVPGVSQGIPSEYRKGGQQALEQQMVEPPPQPEPPKPKPKPQPRRVATPQPAPQQAAPRQAQSPAWPSQPPQSQQQQSGSPWPARQQAPATSSWPSSSGAAQ